MGPNTVSRLRTTATARPPARERVPAGVPPVVAGAAGGAVSAVVVTRPSFLGGRRWEATSEGTRVGAPVAGPGYPGSGRTPLVTPAVRSGRVRGSGATGRGSAPARTSPTPGRGPAGALPPDAAVRTPPPWPRSPPR